MPTLCSSQGVLVGFSDEKNKTENNNNNNNIKSIHESEMGIKAIKQMSSYLSRWCLNVLCAYLLPFRAGSCLLLGVASKRMASRG